MSSRLLQRFGIAAVTVLGSAACDRATLHEPRSATIGTAGAKLIRIVSKAGVLSIDGREGAQSAVVRAVAYGSGRRVLRRIKLVTARAGDVVTIQPVMPRRRFFNWGNYVASMNMSITVPAGVAIEITDSSGDIVARGVGPLKIADGSGGIELQGIAGSVDINDGSGEIEISGVDGDVRVADGSGGIEIENVTGNLNVPNDGSGTLAVARVGGSVHIADKGSGTLNVSHVGADLIVGDKGSGRVRYDDVRGKVAVPKR